MLQSGKERVEEPVVAVSTLAAMGGQIGIHHHVRRLVRLFDAYSRASLGHKVTDLVLLQLEEGGLDGGHELRSLLHELHQILDGSRGESVKALVVEEATDGVALAGLWAAIRHDGARATLQAAMHSRPDDLKQCLLVHSRPRTENMVKAQRLPRVALLGVHLDAFRVLADRD
jgi:hypothetical protein